MLSIVYNGFLAVFPTGITVLLMIATFVFIAIVAVNIVLSIVWVVNQLKELFHLI